MVMVHQGRYLRGAPTGRLTFAYCSSWCASRLWGSAVLGTPRNSTRQTAQERTSNWSLHKLIRRAICLLSRIAACKIGITSRPEVQKYFLRMAACEICLLPFSEREEIRFHARRRPEEQLSVNSGIQSNL